MIPQLPPSRRTVAINRRSSIQPRQCSDDERGREAKKSQTRDDAVEAAKSDFRIGVEERLGDDSGVSQKQAWSRKNKIKEKQRLPRMTRPGG